MDIQDRQPAPNSPLTEPDEAVAEPGEDTEEVTVAEQGNGVEAETSLAAEDLTPEALQEQLDQQRRQAEEYLDHLQRLQAEFHNYRRRASQEHLQAASRGKEEVLRALLPVLANFRLAVQHAEEDANTVRQGVEMIWQQFEGFLRDQKVEQIKTVGYPFDPAQHEALSMAPATEESPADTIMAEINAGYLVDGRLLCPAQVVVARAETPPDMAETEEPPPSIDIEA